jgi:hypothetical protein
MAKKIKLTPYDPDKYRDELSRDAWKESGYKTSEEYSKWHLEEMREFREAVQASGLSMIEYAIQEKSKQA